MKKKNKIGALHFIAFLIALIGYCFLDDIVAIGIALIVASLVFAFFLAKKYNGALGKDPLTLMAGIVVVVVSFGVICFAREVGVGENIQSVMIFPVISAFYLTRKVSELIHTGTFKDCCIEKRIVIPRVLFVSWTALLMLAMAIYVITQRDGLWAYIFFAVTFFMLIGLLWLLIAAIYCNSLLYRELRIGYFPDLVLFATWLESQDFLDYFPAQIQILLVSVIVLDVVCCYLERNANVNDYGTHNFDE